MKRTRRCETKNQHENRKENEKENVLQKNPNRKFSSIQSLPLQSLPIQSLPVQSLPIQSLPIQIRLFFKKNCRQKKIGNQKKKKKIRKQKQPKEDKDLLFLDQVIREIEEETKRNKIENELNELCLGHSGILGIAITLLEKIPTRFFVESFFSCVQEFLGFEDHSIIQFGVIKIGFYDLKEMRTRLKKVTTAQEVYDMFWINAALSNLVDGSTLNRCHKYLEEASTCCELLCNMVETLIFVRKIDPTIFADKIKNVRPDEDQQMKGFGSISWPEKNALHEPHDYFTIYPVIWGISDEKCVKCRKTPKQIIVTSCCYSEQIICSCFVEDNQIGCLNASQSCYNKKLDIFDIAGEMRQNELREIKRAIRQSLLESE